MTTNQPVGIHCQSEPDVLALLRRQSTLFDALGTLSRTQRGAIEEGPADAVISLLARRQQVVEQLTALAEELEPYRACWQDTRDGLDPNQCAEADRLLDRSEQSLRAILECDDQDRTLLMEARQKAGDELSRIHRSGRALDAYGAAPPVDRNRYTDRCG